MTDLSEKDDLSLCQGRQREPFLLLSMDVIFQFLILIQFISLNFFKLNSYLLAFLTFDGFIFGIYFNTRGSSSGWCLLLVQLIFFHLLTLRFCFFVYPKINRRQLRSLHKIQNTLVRKICRKKKKKC